MGEFVQLSRDVRRRGNQYSLGVVSIVSSVMRGTLPLVELRNREQERPR